MKKLKFLILFLVSWACLGVFLIYYHFALMSLLQRSSTLPTTAVALAFVALSPQYFADGCCLAGLCGLVSSVMS